MSCPCGGCKLYGTFECVSSMDLQSLMNKIGITFLPAGDDPTDDPNKLDEELEKRFMDWRYVNQTLGPNILLKTSFAFWS